MSTTPGLVSVIVPAFDVAEYLADALESVLAQDAVELELVVVDDGSRDGSGEIADSFAARDPRVRVIHQANAGLGGARNAGIAAARGEFLTFVDADDVLPPGALAALTASLRDSGSELAVGRVHRVSPAGVHNEPVWITESHAAAPLRGVTIAEHPLAIKDIVACNRLYRRSSWDERIGSFPLDVAYEDHVPMLRSYLGGARFDVLDEVTYLWRTRADRTSISQRKAEESNLADRLTVMELAWDAVAPEGPAARSMWLARALELDLAGFYRHAAASGPSFRARLRDAAARYLGLAGPEALRFVSVHRKVSAWLAAGEHWDALEWLEHPDGVLTLRRSAHLEDGWPVADTKALDRRFGLELPRELAALSENDTSVRTDLRAVRHTVSSVEVDFDVWLRGVKRPSALESVQLELTVPGSSAAPPLVVEATHRGRHASAVIDIDELRAWAGRDSARVRVAARLSWGDVDRSAPVGSSHHRLPLRRPAQSRGVMARLGSDGALELRIGPAPRPTTALRVGRGHAVARLVDGERLRVELPKVRRRRPLSRFRSATGRSRLQWPDGEELGIVLPRGPLARRARWRWEATARDEAVLVARSPLLELTGAAVRGDALELTLEVRDGAGLDLGRVRWSAGRATPGRGSVTVRLDARDVRSLSGPTPLTASEGKGKVEVRFAWALLDEAPLRFELGGRVVRLRAGRRREPVLVAPRSR